MHTWTVHRKHHRAAAQVKNSVHLGPNENSANYSISQPMMLNCELVVQQKYFPKELKMMTQQCWFHFPLYQLLFNEDILHLLPLEPTTFSSLFANTHSNQMIGFNLHHTRIIAKSYCSYFIKQPNGCKGGAVFPQTSPVFANIWKR